MSRKNSNGIIDSLAVIGESFRNIDISEEGIVSFLNSELYIHLFEDVPDFRQPGKVTYRLPDLLMMIFLVTIERGKTSYVTIADYIEVKQAQYRSYGLLQTDDCPSHDTIRRILTFLDGSAICENTLTGFYNFLRSLEKHLSKTGDYRHISFDGKEMRGSGRSKNTQTPKQNTAMLNVYDTGLATVIRCEPIDDKKNEIPAAQQILRTMDLRNTVLTADALHCQKETARIIAEQKGIYVLTVKDNQPLLAEEINARFKNPKSKVSHYELDKRNIEILDLPVNYALKDEWSGLKSFIRMVSARSSGPCERFFISNTKDHRLITDAIEHRWSCEDMHKIKDMDLYEDAIRSTDKRALQNLATMNNLAVQLFHLYQMISGLEFRKAKLTFQVEPIKCLNTILGVMSSQEIVDSLIRDLKKSRKTR